ncbi:MAG: hypothetical protein K6F53_00035 [Lachnospiraceae bacterium]|nr:hypothetical protein [Lachnospiraceae bacterium]
MKSKLTHNLGLKLLSLVIALVLWATVRVITDPVNTRIFNNVQVNLINTEQFAERGQIYEILDDSDRIRVTLRGPSSLISQITAQNIIATADVKELSKLDTVSIKVESNLFTDRVSTTPSIDTVKLKVESKKSKTMPLSLEITGTPAEGYIAGDYSSDQNLVRLTGPESVIDRIESAKVTVDVSGFSSDVRTNSEIRLYDAEGEMVTSDSLTQNIRTVGVSVTILQTKEIPVYFHVSTEALAGYRGTGLVTSDKDTALISGRSSALKNVEAVNVPADAIDVSEQSESFTVPVDITPYLPGGVSLVDPADSIYNVTVYIEAEASRRIGITTEDIRITSVPEGYHASLSVEEGTMLELIGLSDTLQSLTKQGIDPVIDLAAFAASQNMAPEAPEEGFFTAEVNFTLPPGVSVLDRIYATIHIVKDEEEE